MKSVNPWAKIDELMAAESIPEGEGWFTTTEFIEKYNVNERTARDKLIAWVKDGIIEKRRGVTRTCKKPQNYFRYLDK